MIPDEELSQLPVDPQLAFVRLEQIMRERLGMQEKEATDVDLPRLEYMNKVAAAALAYKIDGLEKLFVPPDASGPLATALQQFTRQVDRVTMQIRIRSAQMNREGSVGLEDTAKAKIRHYIAQIKDAIDKAELPDDKREALYDKLNKFAAEVDKVRTALQAGMAVFIAVCDGINQGFIKLEPARKWLDSIAAILGRAKAEEERADYRLPPPAERKQLEPPPEKPSGSGAKPVRKTNPTIDGDINFE